jgi:hypothetical protein
VIIVTAIVTQPVVSAAPSMAEGTASVEPASGAEKAPTARPEALQSRAYGGEGQDVEVARRQDPREGRVGECQRGTLMVTVHNGCGPNQGHAGHCGQKIVGRSASGQDLARKGLTSWEPKEGRVRHRRRTSSRLRG